MIDYPWRVLSCVNSNAVTVDHFYILSNKDRNHESKDWQAVPEVAMDVERSRFRDKIMYRYSLSRSDLPELRASI